LALRLNDVRQRLTPKLSNYRRESSPSYSTLEALSNDSIYGTEFVRRVNPATGGPIHKVASEMQIERSAGKASTSAGGRYALYDIDCEGDKVTLGQRLRKRLSDQRAVRRRRNRHGIARATTGIVEYQFGGGRRICLSSEQRSTGK
jgi:hypothetical protein